MICGCEAASPLWRNRKGLHLPHGVCHHLPFAPKQLLELFIWPRILSLHSEGYFVARVVHFSTAIRYAFEPAFTVPHRMRQERQGAHGLQGCPSNLYT